MKGWPVDLGNRGNSEPLASGLSTHLYQSLVWRGDPIQTPVLLNTTAGQMPARAGEVQHDTTLHRAWALGRRTHRGPPQVTNPSLRRNVLSCAREGSDAAGEPRQRGWPCAPAIAIWLAAAPAVIRVQQQASASAGGRRTLCRRRSPGPGQLTHAAPGGDSQGAEPPAVPPRDGGRLPAPPPWAQGRGRPA